MWGHPWWEKGRHVKGLLPLPDGRGLEKAVTLRGEEQLGVGADPLLVPEL